jgi:pantoate--beta-alanine ligase
VHQKISEEPLAQIDYVTLVDNETLETIDKIGETEALLAVAARFGDVRLIDNVILNRRQ